MIQALNSANTNRYNTNKNQSFKCNDCHDQAGFYNCPPRSNAKRVAGFIGREFLTGALVSAVVDGLGNAWAAARKNPEAMVSLSSIAKRAGFWGVAWIAMGTIIGLVSGRNKH